MLSIILGFFLMPGGFRQEKLRERVLGPWLLSSHFTVRSRRRFGELLGVLEAGLARGGQVVLVFDRSCGVVVVRRAGSAVGRRRRCRLIASKIMILLQLLLDLLLLFESEHLLVIFGGKCGLLLVQKDGLALASVLLLGCG